MPPSPLVMLEIRGTSSVLITKVTLGLNQFLCSRLSIGSTLVHCPSNKIHIGHLVGTLKPEPGRHLVSGHAETRPITHDPSIEERLMLATHFQLFSQLLTPQRHTRKTICARYARCLRLYTSYSSGSSVQQWRDDLPTEKDRMAQSSRIQFIYGSYDSLLHNFTPRSFVQTKWHELDEQPIKIKKELPLRS